MDSYLKSALHQFRYYEGLGMKTMEQLDDAALFHRTSPSVNSVAVIVKHLHGNMRSRWTDFLESDGEKDWRNRDQEFEHTLNTREDVYRAWREGWACVFEALTPLGPEDLARTVFIRSEAHTVVEAVNRQLCHYAYHVGQIVQIGKEAQGDHWQSLSIPLGQSAAFNREKMKGQ